MLAVDFVLYVKGKLLHEDKPACDICCVMTVTY